MFERTALFPSALMFLLISSFGLILALLALFGKERGIGTVGAWFTVYAVILTLSRAVAGRAADRFGYPQVATAGLVLVAAGLLIMASAHSAWVLLLSAIVYGLGYGTTQPSLQAMLVDRAPVARVGAATAVFFFAYDLGTTVGSVGGGSWRGCSDWAACSRSPLSGRSWPWVFSLVTCVAREALHLRGRRALRTRS
ncbi:MAG: MFS transporter [Thermoleophilia bacterium]|nr:MFS transporter [Thermoleophilia bacterium]